MSSFPSFTMLHHRCRHWYWFSFIIIYAAKSRVSNAALSMDRSHVTEESDRVAQRIMDDSKVIDSVLVARLLEMGFSDEEASVALSRSDNSMDGALAFLLQDEPAPQFNEGQESASEEISEITEPHLGEEGDWEDVDDEVPEDPIKMIIAVNTEFKMSVGKIASQVAHAAVGLYGTISSKKSYCKFIHDWNEGGSKKVVLDGKNTATLKLLIDKAIKLKIRHCAIEDTGLTEVPPGSLTAVAFIGRASKKIVLNGKNTATLKFLAEQAKKMKLKYYVVRDAGLTEIPPGSWTAVAAFGRDSAVSKIFGQLPLLK